jgi:hypothetical protein
MTEVPTCIVGTKFHGIGALAAVEAMRVGQPITLKRVNHPKDPNAVECHYLGVFCGFVPRQANPAIARAFDAGKTPIAFITERAVVRAGRVRVEPKITVSWD